MGRKCPQKPVGICSLQAGKNASAAGICEDSASNSRKQKQQKVTVVRPKTQTLGVHCTCQQHAVACRSQKALAPCSSNTTQVASKHGSQDTSDSFLYPVPCAFSP